MQPVEVAPTVEEQANDEPQALHFTWKIENFGRLNKQKLYSDVFIIGDYKWRVLIFPKGNNVDYLSLYLDVADSATLPYGWRRHARFSIAVVNQINSKYTIKKDTSHEFNEGESDWGFSSFIPLSELNNPSEGYLVNDLLVVEADFSDPKQMLTTVTTTQMTNSSTEAAEQTETQPTPAKGEQTHTLAVDNNAVAEISPGLIGVGVYTMADEIRDIMNLELEEAEPHMSAKLQIILLKIKDSTAKGLTPTMEAQLENLMLAAHDLGMDYVGAKSGVTECEQSAQTYREMDEKVLEAKNAMAVDEASMITLKANIQETRETIQRAEEEIRKARATIEDAKILQETYTESLSLKCLEKELLDQKYKAMERRVAKSLRDRQVHKQRESRAEHKLNAARQSWEEIKKTWAELEAVLPEEVYVDAGQPTSDSCVGSSSD